MNAVTATYNRKTKGYDIETRTNADLILGHSGWFVYDGSAASAIGFMEKMGTFDDKPKKREAVLSYLRTQTTQAELDAEIGKIIDQAAGWEECREKAKFESPAYWDYHDKAIACHEAARRMMPKGS